MYEKRAYEVCQLEPLSPILPEIYSGDLDDEIRSRLYKVIEVESPIEESLLVKRVLNSLSYTKCGHCLEECFRDLLDSLTAIKTKEGERTIYWKDDKGIDYYRVAPSEVRFSYQIPPSEAINAALATIKGRSRFFSKNQLFEVIIKNLGFTKSGSQLWQLYFDTVELGLKRGDFKITKNYRYYS